MTGGGRSRHITNELRTRGGGLSHSSSSKEQRTKASLLTASIGRGFVGGTISLRTGSCASGGIVCHGVVGARDLVACSVAAYIGRIACSWRINGQLRIDVSSWKLRNVHLVAHDCWGVKEVLVEEASCEATTATKPVRAAIVSFIFARCFVGCTGITVN